MKAVLDTNVAISAIFFAGVPLEILNAERHGRLTFVATPETVAEYRRIAERIGEAYPEIPYKRAFALFLSRLEMVTARTLPGPVTADPKDDMFVACALGARAKLICSGDHHLLDVNGYHGLEILKAADFKEKYLQS